MSNANDSTSYAPFPPDDDEAAIAAAAHALANVPPVRLLKLFSVVLATIAANLHEASEAGERRPMTAAGLIRRRVRRLDELLDVGVTEHRAELTAERNRLAALLVADIAGGAA